MKIYVTQLRELFGISNPSADSIRIVPSKKNGIAQWEKDALVRRSFDSMLLGNIKFY
jgi:hypothetical protein